MPSNEENVQSISRLAAADYSAINNRFVNIDANGKAVLATTADRADGVLRSSGVADEAVNIAIGGRVLIEAGGTIAAGDTLQVTTSGKALTQTSTNPVMGTALESGVSGDIISMLFAPQGAP